MKTELSKMAKDVKSVATKNSPTILTGLGVAGLISTVALAIKATPKAIWMIEEERYIRESQPVNFTPKFEKVDDKDLTKIQIIRLVWKEYIPTAISGAVSIACIIGANSINLRRNAALASLYSITETTLKEYKSKVVEAVGEEKAQEIHDKVSDEIIKKNPPKEKTVIMTGKGETLCYDQYTGRYFKSDPNEINRAVNELNKTLLHEDTLSLNELYYALGLPETKMGDQFGWHVDDGLIEVSFSSRLAEDDKPCLVLDFDSAPLYNYSIHH